MANTLTSLVSLPKPIDESQIFQDLENLQQAHNTVCDQLEKILCGVQSAAAVGVNAAAVDTGGRPTVLLQNLSAGCIATIFGQILGRPFTLIAQSVGSFGIAEAGVFSGIAGAWQPGTTDSITLVWDGTAFTELCRSNN